MSDDMPERIWINGRTEDRPYVTGGLLVEDSDYTGYVRADLVAELVAALEPFAVVGAALDAEGKEMAARQGGTPEDGLLFIPNESVALVAFGPVGPKITVGDLRRAAEALSRAKGGTDGR